MLLGKNVWQSRETGNIWVRVAILHVASGNACPEGGRQKT